jgi:hypothetical protein
LGWWGCQRGLLDDLRGEGVEALLGFRELELQLA